uniref:Uncharacterized protein n=1 Tax=Knipowitschia caucasica TaxID=637954 RepID=A0AAV2JRI5_KNICA
MRTGHRDQSETETRSLGHKQVRPAVSSGEVREDPVTRCGSKVLRCKVLLKFYRATVRARLQEENRVKRRHHKSKGCRGFLCHEEKGV